MKLFNGVRYCNFRSHFVYQEAPAEEEITIDKEVEELKRFKSDGYVVTCRLISTGDYVADWHGDFDKRYMYAVQPKE